MNASQAKSRTYEINRSAKAIKAIDKLIEKSCDSGLFKMSTRIYYDWGNVHDLVLYYQKCGYKVSTSHTQTSPNDGDDYIYINWED